MGQPVVHFEILGSDPQRLREFYAELFGWDFALGDTVSAAASAPGQYGFVDGAANGEAPANGGVGGGEGFEPRALFYVGVDEVEAALAAAERLGGRRVLGPDGEPGKLVIGRFTDPEGNLIGVAAAR